MLSSLLCSPTFLPSCYFYISRYIFYSCITSITQLAMPYIQGKVTCTLVMRLASYVHIKCWVNYINFVRFCVRWHLKCVLKLQECFLGTLKMQYTISRCVLCWHSILHTHLFWTLPKWLHSTLLDLLLDLLYKDTCHYISSHLHAQTKLELHMYVV